MQIATALRGASGLRLGVRSTEEVGRCCCGVEAGSMQCLPPESCSKVSGLGIGYKVAWELPTLGTPLGRSAIGCCHPHATVQVEPLLPVMSHQPPLLTDPHLMLPGKEKCFKIPSSPLSQSSKGRVTLELRGNKSVSGLPSSLWLSFLNH